MARKMHTFRIHVRQTIETIVLVSVEAYGDSNDVLVRKILSKKADKAAKESVMEGKSLGTKQLLDVPLRSRCAMVDMETRIATYKSESGNDVNVQLEPDCQPDITMMKEPTP